MALKDLLVCLDPTEAGERRLRLAASIAREHQAHLSASYILSEAIPGVSTYEGVGIPAATGATEIAQGSVVAGVPLPGAPPIIPYAASPGAELADIVEQRFRAEVQPHGIDGNWHLFGSGDSEELIALSRTMDMVVFGQVASDYRLPTGFSPEDIVMASGRPMLVVPGRDCHGVQGRLQELLRESFGIDHATLQIDHAAEPLLTIGGDARASRDNHNAKGPEHTGGCADSSSEAPR